MTHLHFFARDQGGNIAILFALSIIPVLALVGAGIDYGRSAGMKTTIDRAADAAALAAVKTVFDQIEAGEDPDFDAAEEIGQITFDSQFEGQQPPTIAIDVIEREDGYTASIQYETSVETAFLGVIGINHVTIRNQVEASSGPPSQLPYLDITLMLDTSSSMGIGATDADIAILMRTSGCAFACHDPSYRREYYDGPRQAGARFRIDALKDATASLLTAAEAANNKSDDDEQIVMSVFSYNDQLTYVANDSANYGTIRSRVSGIQLPSYHDDTTTTALLETVNRNYLEDSGDGSDQDKRKRFLFLVTDGVESSIYRQSPFRGLSPRGLWGNTGTINPSVCQAIKDRDITVGVIYVEYIRFSTWQFGTLIQPFHGLLPTRLEDCASEGFYIRASRPGEIDAAMKKMFKDALISSDFIRLTK